MVSKEERSDGTDNIDVFDKIKTNKILVGTGDGTGELEGAGMVFSTATSVSNAGGAAEDLGAYTITANSMPADSAKAVRVKAWGKTAADADAKVIDIKFGATVVATHASANTNDKDWVLEATIIQGATGAQSAYGKLYLEGAANELIFVTTPAETQTGAIVVALNADGTNAGDIILKGMTVEFLN